MSENLILIKVLAYLLQSELLEDLPRLHDIQNTGNTEFESCVQSTFRIIVYRNDLEYSYDARGHLLPFYIRMWYYPKGKYGQPRYNDPPSHPDNIHYEIIREYYISSVNKHNFELILPLGYKDHHSYIANKIIEHINKTIYDLETPF